MIRIAATLALLFVLLTPGGARADTIMLKRSVRLDPAVPVTLAQIAELDGANAQRLSETVITARLDQLPRDRAGAAAGQIRYRLDPTTVRDALDRSARVNWAFLTVRGGDILILPLDSNLPTKTDAARTPETQADSPQLTATPPGSVGEFTRDVVLKILRVADADLRIVWPSRHAEFLSEPVGGRTVHVQPIGTSDRMPLSITIYELDRIARKETVRAEIRVRRSVKTVSRVLPRGTPIAQTDFTSRDAWVGPGTDPAGEIIGQIASRRLEPGSIVQTTDIAPPLVIERGEQITLHCVSGAVAIRSPARALGDARDGETLIVEMAGTGKRVMARANGPGKAVLVVRTNTMNPQQGAAQ